MDKAMPLSQYLMQTLSVDNPLQSQEDRVRFLNEAEPILKQIQAPRLALLLRKRVAELAGVSEAEMREMIALPETVRRPKPQQSRQPRSTLSLQRQFAVMLLMQPGLARQEDMDWANGHAEEDVLVRMVLQAALMNPQSNPAALVQELQSRVDAGLLRDIQRELHVLDEQLDVALAFEGARKQLKELMLRRQHALLLERIKEKSLSELTEEEKALLKSGRGS